MCLIFIVIQFARCYREVVRAYVLHGERAILSGGRVTTAGSQSRRVFDLRLE